MKFIHLNILIFVIAVLCSCAGEDRTGEIPYAPTVSTKSATVQGDSCILTGEVLSSPNSSLTACGFSFGTSDKQTTITVESPSYEFSTTVDSLQTQQDYFAVAYATNGMGTSYGDTIWFKIAE